MRKQPNRPPWETRVEGVKPAPPPAPPSGLPPPPPSRPPITTAEIALTFGVPEELLQEGDEGAELERAGRTLIELASRRVSRTFAGRVVELLEAIEWKGNLSGYAWPRCPSCSNEPSGHGPHCRLAALLAEAKAIAERP